MLFADKDRVKVAIQDQHTNIILIEKNGEVVFEKEQNDTARNKLLFPLLFSPIKTTVSPKQISISFKFL